VNNRFAASALLYGTPLALPFPDIERTSFLLMVGANPLVSHGSVLSTPRIRERLNAIEARGGRVVVVDPRNSETARQFEHQPIQPDTDVWMLLSMLQVIFAEGLADEGFIASTISGAEQLRALVAEHTPEATADRTGIAPERLRELARAFATAESAAAYGRTGSCLGRFGTLVAFLLDALAASTGNIDRPGGLVFGDPPVALEELAEKVGLATYGKIHSRFGDFPDVLGNLPASLLPREIETPGERQIRAFFVSAGNPVLSVPDGDALERALGTLDLMVSLDLYVNETNRHADYVLPATTMYEREDLPVAFMALFSTPFVQHTEAVVEPPPGVKQEWEIIDAIAERIGVVPFSLPALRLLGKVRKLTPRTLIDLLLRTGSNGDLFGLRRGGLSLRKLVEDHPHGLVLADHVKTGILGKKLRGRDRIDLAPPAIVTELARATASNGNDPDYPLRLIGLRELRSHNSWMHNAPLLMRGGRSQPIRIHPDDAEAHGLEDGGRATIESKDGSIEVPVMVTEEMTPGAVALPHGWGHRGGWQLANANAGVNFNELTSGDPDDLEALAGMAFLTGIPVRVAPLVAGRAANAEAVSAPA
jgi:formate dehydrogenase